MVHGPRPVRRCRGNTPEEELTTQLIGSIGSRKRAASKILFFVDNLAVFRSW